MCANASKLYFGLVEFPVGYFRELHDHIAGAGLQKHVSTICVLAALFYCFISTNLWQNSLD
jgi:hypothetical protein